MKAVPIALWSLMAVRNAVRFRHLDDIAKRLARVEKALQQERR